jgi:hypothetical protein
MRVSQIIGAAFLLPIRNLLRMAVECSNITRIFARHLSSGISMTSFCPCPIAFHF